MSNAESLIVAELVYDGSDVVTVPSSMEAPAPNQMQGTAHERLGEVACRTCYDSCGINPETQKPKGRSSDALHAHILEVDNTSVYEHCVFTVRMGGPDPEIFACCLLNRPGVWAEIHDGAVEITLNHRSVLEWDYWGTSFSRRYSYSGRQIGAAIREHARTLAPRLYPGEALPFRPNVVLDPKTENLNAHQAWVSLYLSMSRGGSHENVRHRFRTGVSQRCLDGESFVTCVSVSSTGKINGTITGKKPRTLKRIYDLLHHNRLRNSVFRMHVRVLDESTGFFTTGKIEDVLYSGKKECFQVTLEDGKSLKCTRDHRIMTNEGWKTLGEIADPKVTEGGVVCWNRETPFMVGVNGIEVVGKGLYRDVDWLRQRYIVEGRSYEEMAEESDCTPHLVRFYTAKMGLRKKRGEDILLLYKDPEWLRLRYREEGRTLSEMAEESRCSTHIIRTYLRKFGLQKKMCEIRLGSTPWNKGISYSHAKTYSPETIERYRLSKTGEKNPQWKGGRGSEERRAFQTWKRENRKIVFERDGYSCRICSRHSSDVPINSRHMRKRAIEIHHIIPMWNRPDLACDINNVATVCWECHCRLLQNHEMEYVDQLQEAIKSPVRFSVSDRIKKIPSVRRVKIHYKKIEKITPAGVIDTYDLVLQGENHGFVANGIVVHNSSRFCDEDGSPYVQHPLEAFYLETCDDEDEKAQVRELIQKSKEADGNAYRGVNDALSRFLKDRGVNGTNARKQARGTARGYLGNALFTDMIFSASAFQWRWILNQRGSVFADGEIRQLYAPGVLTELQKSQYGHFFSDLELAPSPDGIGQVVVGWKED